MTLRSIVASAGLVATVLLVATQDVRPAACIYEPGGPEWKAYLQEHVKLGTTFDPTMTAYAAGRDVMRMRNADWHDRYTLPSLMEFYTPSLVNHGSYFHDWTSTDEVAWRNFYQVWFKLLNDYKRMGGRVTVSADEAFIYNT